MGDVLEFIFLGCDESKKEKEKGTPQIPTPAAHNHIILTFPNHTTCYYLYICCCINFSTTSSSATKIYSTNFNGTNSKAHQHPFVVPNTTTAPLDHHPIRPSTPLKKNLFRENIGAKFNNVKFFDVPVNQNVDFHFILSFAIDYDSSGMSPTNGKFNLFWDTDNLSPSHVSSVKKCHSNVKVALRRGGDSVGSGYAYFNPSSVDSWVSNAVSTLTNIIKQFNPDGIDIDYEHFCSDPHTFVECIGRLIKTLKKNGVISFTSIAPFDDDQVQSHYLALWKKYGHFIDYVNFQFYAYDEGTTVDEFIDYFNTQSSNYHGGKVLTSFISDRNGGLSLENGFFATCNRLKRQKRLYGIFVWSADDSKKYSFRYEKRSQALLAGRH